MFLATKGFQTSQWLFYLSLIVYVIKQRKDIDWNLWAWDWNSMQMIKTIFPLVDIHVNRNPILNIYKIFSSIYIILNLRIIYLWYDWFKVIVFIADMTLTLTKGTLHTTAVKGLDLIFFLLKGGISDFSSFLKHSACILMLRSTHATDNLTHL